MKLETLVNQLAELPGLYKEALALSSYSQELWLAQGLITAEELVEYAKLQQIEEDISEQIYQAQKGVAWLDKEYPKEYQAVLARLAELEPYILLVKKIGDTLFNIRNDSHKFDEFGVKELVKSIRSIFFKTPDPEKLEYEELAVKRERLGRTGSKVMKIREVAGKAHILAVTEAKANAEARLKAKYATQLARKRELDQLMRSRRLDKFGRKWAQIKELLEVAIRLAG